MNSKNLHRLLKRQLNKSKTTDLLKCESATGFIDKVNDAYKSFDKDISHLENILEQSSRELYKANQALKKEVDYSINRLEYIVRNINGVLFQLDKSGNFIYLSPAWKQLTGLSISDTLDTKYSSFLTDNNKSEKSKIEAFFDGDKLDKQTVFKFQNKTGQTKYIEVSVNYRYNEKGDEIGTIGTFTDVTKLKVTQLKLKRANKAKDEFLAKMSHDMRTPLNSLIGLSNLLLMERHLPEQKESLNALKFSAEHLLDLINGILDFNKIESKTVVFEKKEFSLNYMLEIFRRNFQFQAYEKNLEFEINKIGLIPNMVVGDNIKLSQIINNLLSNALKFTNNGKIGINIKELESTINYAKIRFQIFDTGIGIPKSEQKTIFKKFKQVNSSGVDPNAGTGLGLSICKELIELQGSKLKLKSKEGEGSVFEFDLKIDLPKTNSKDGKKSLFEDEYSNLKTKILVVEDNKLNILVISKFLNKWGANFEIAENGLEAVKLIADNAYDVVLMDLEMPIMNGYEATQRVRLMSNPEKRSIPIVALTASALNEVEKKAKKCGVDEFLTKPFKPDQLYHILKQFEPVYFSKDIV